MRNLLKEAVGRGDDGPVILALQHHFEEELVHQEEY